MHETSRVNQKPTNQIHSSDFCRRLLLALAFVAIALSCAASYGSESGPTGSQVPSSIASSAPIWFHPLPAASSSPQGSQITGSTDFLQLFEEHPQWPRALEKTKVIGLYAGWITAASDQDLQQIVSFLNAHQMGIEIEAPALQAEATCGSGVEGYVPYGQSLYDFTLAYLQRLRALNAPVAYIKVDEPFYFGSVVNDPRSCHFPVPQVAFAVAQYVQLVKSVYPNTAVGDVEPIIANAYPVNVIQAMRQWHAVYQAISGAPFPFFFADTDFSNPAWPQIVKTLETSTHQQGIPFGMIYIGDPDDVSDAEWAAKAVARFRIYQGAAGGQPDIVLFQSWEVHPRFCLPESNPTTFTGVLDTYIDFTK